MGWVVYFSKNFRKLAASTLCKGKFDDTIILQRSLENSYALPNTDELLCDFWNINRCLLFAANSLFTQLLCSCLCLCLCLQRCAVKRFSAVTFTSRNLQNKIIPWVVKYFSPNYSTKPRNLTLSEHFTLGILKVETVLRYSIQNKASFTNSGFVHTASAVYNFYYFLFYTEKADRTIIARTQIFSITSQNMDNELRWTERGKEKKSNIFFLLHAQCFWHSKWLMPYQ
jgi:hypothetical protein